MSWAGKRRLLIVAILATIVLIVVLGISYFSLHTAPSCVDSKQNQGEQGIDCGGPCAYLCTELEQAPVVRFTQAFSSGVGRTSIIASIDNPNDDAYARSIAYSVSLYGADHTLGAPVIHGVIDLAPGASLPVFIPNIDTKNTTIVSAFLTIEPSTIKWQKGIDTRNVPKITTQDIGGTIDAPRITATLTNASARPIQDLKVVVIVYDALGNVLTASQTIVPTIGGQGSAVATFSWPAAFASMPARVEVIPLVPLP